MALPIRSCRVEGHTLPSSSCPSELRPDVEQRTGGLPWLHGELGAATTRPLLLVLRIHNRAGIPIAEGQGVLGSGQREFTISDLRPLGIEAYSHYKEEQRAQIGQRIWSRSAYASLTLSAAS